MQLWHATVYVDRAEPCRVERQPGQGGDQLWHGVVYRNSREQSIACRLELPSWLSVLRGTASTVQRLKRLAKRDDTVVA